MSDYFKAEFNISPRNEDAADLLAAFLADIGFESFEPDGNRLVAYIQADLWNTNAIEEIIKSFPIDVKIEFSKEFIEHQDWNEEWEKNYFQPIILGNGKCVIHSTFHKDFPKAPIDIVVDPKMAFGTGHHATTSMMVNFLFENDLRGKNIMDMGTGTGILGIIAEKLGAKNIKAIEIDPSAYENALENCKLNNSTLDLYNGDAKLLSNVTDIDLFLANINRNIILEDLAAYIQTLRKPSGMLMLSGFYESDIPVLENAISDHDMKIAEIKTSPEGWSAIRTVFI